VGSAAALRVLGARAAEVVRLGLPDSGLSSREDELTAALAPLVAGFDMCLAPWDRDMNPDHEAAGRPARRAWSGSLYYYPVWMWR
jgi:LmbE family N-acetylglucosaminyl deacetylase